MTAPSPPQAGAAARAGFISYSHEDHALYKRMRQHLKPVERSLNLSFWADERIAPGEKWNDEIAEAIDRAAVHLLLISPGFLASDYIIETELPAIMAKYAGGDLVLPVILRRCMWQPFVAVLQALPTTRGRLLPVCEWKPQDNGFDRAREQSLPEICRHLGAAPPPQLAWNRP